MPEQRINFYILLLLNAIIGTSSQVTTLYLDPKSGSQTSDGLKSTPFKDLSSCFAAAIDESVVYKILILNNVTITAALRLQKRQMILTKDESVMESIFITVGSIGSLSLIECRMFQIRDLNIQLTKDLASLYFINFISNTSLTLELVGLKDQEIPATSAALLLGEESSVFVRLCNFENLSIRGGALIKISAINEQTETEIKDTLFRKINQRNPGSFGPLISISKLSSSFSLRNSSFLQNNATMSLVSVVSSKKNISLDNCFFSENWVGVSALNFENVNQLRFSLTTVEKLNKINAANLSGGGCAIVVQNAINVLFFKFVLQDSYSNLTAVGVKIIDDSRLATVMGIDSSSPQPQKVHINESSFLRNYVFFETLNQVGCALLMSSASALIIENSTFYKNLMNSTDLSNLKAGSPCLNSLSTKNNVTIVFSHFIENKSRFLGNCLLVSGFSLFINATVFRKNYPIVSAYIWNKYNSYYGAPRSIMVSHEENGGSLFSLCNQVSIIKSIFSGSGGNNGGAIFFSVNSDSDGSLFLRIQEVFFDMNEGGMNGGHLFLYSKMTTMDALINSSYFSNGDADQGGVLGSYFKCKQCYLTINGSFFTRNSATFGAAVDFANEDGYSFVNNSIFMNQTALNPKISLGSGSVFRFGANTKAYLECKRNIYLNNFGASRGEFSVKIVKFYESDSMHLYTVANEGAVLTAIMFGSLEFNNCIFIRAQATNNAGGFHMIESASITVKNSYFEGCIAKRNGAVVLGMERILLRMENTSFFNNEAYTGTIFQGQENFGSSSRVDFINCNASNNKAVGELFSISDTNFMLKNCLITSQQTSVILGFTSVIQVIDSTFINITCLNVREGCVFSAQDNTKLRIDGVRVSNIYSKVSGGGIYSENSSVIISKFLTSYITVETFGSVLSSFLSYILINQSSFIEHGANCFYMKYTTIQTENSEFINRPGKAAAVNLNRVLFGTIYIESPNGTCIFKNTSFTGNEYSMSGGAFYIFNADIDDASKSPAESISVVINSCSFLLNAVQSEGGAIYNWRQNLLIQDSLFELNSAQNGGALFLDSDDENSRRTFVVKNSLFIENKAQLDGGAIKWLGKKPELIGLNYSVVRPNKALYGEHIASFPLRLELKVNKIDRDAPGSTAELIYSSDEDSDEYILEDFISGRAMDYELSFHLLDCYNQTVSTLNKGIVEIDFLEKEYLSELGYSDWNRSGYSHVKISASIVAGRASFSTLTMIVRPPANVTVKAYSSEISGFFSTTLGNLKTLKNILNIKNTFNFLLRINVRPCVLGEIFFEETNSCYFCPEGKFTLNGPYERGDCHTCLPNVECKGGENMQLKKGYWRSSNKSQLIHLCTKNQDFCLGGYESECKVGYSGPLCGGCSITESIKYSRISNFCVECLEKSINELRFAFALIGFIAIMGILVFYTINDASKISKDQSLTMKKCLSIYLKIFMNYIQINAIISALELKWPDYMRSYTNIQTNTGNIPSQIISIECLILERKINTHPVYFRALAATLLPFILIITFQGVLAVIWIVKKRSQLTNMIINFHVVSIFLQPTVLQELTDIITCQEVDAGKFYMIKEMNIECYTSEHRKWSLCMVFPVLTYWVLIYPMGCLLYLNKHQSRLSEIELRRRMGFYLNGFKKKYFYWEFIIMYRKVLVLFLTSILDIPILVKVTCLLALNTLFFYVTIKYRPFVMKDLNDMERNSNLSALCIGYFGLMYLAIDNEFAKGLIFFLLLIVNLNFFLSWAKSILVIMFSSQAQKIYNYCPSLMDRCFSLADTLKNLNITRSFSSQSTSKTYVPKNYKTILIGPSTSNKSRNETLN